MCSDILVCHKLKRDKIITAIKKKKVCSQYQIKFVFN